MFSIPTTDEKYTMYANRKITHDKYGEYTILENFEKELHPSHAFNIYCTIRFTNTGYEYRIRLNDALNGNVYDPYYPTIAGVGYRGEPNERYDPTMYYIWNGMIDRCYNPNCKDYANYGAKGVRVCDEWHNFANFIHDFTLLDGYDEYSKAGENDKCHYCLDKDILQPGMELKDKIYSKDTCHIIYNDYNARESRLRYRNYHECNSKYFGVSVDSYNHGIIQTGITIQGVYYYLGVYNDEIAAANVYNYVAKICVSNPILNDAPYMEINEALSHCTSKKPINFPPEVDTSILNIPYRNHSKYYGVKKKRNNFYGLYHNKDGSQHIGIYDDEIAAASAHNIYMRLFGDGIGHYNKESDEFHEMSLAEIMMHRTYTKATEPKVMIADVDKETHELTWYTEYTYKTKYPPVKADAPGRYTVKPIINGVEYHCGIYSSKEAAICLWAIINRYFNLCYDKKDITMTLSEALSYKFPMSVIEWPEGFDTTKWDQPLPLRVFQNQQQTITPMAPVLNAAYNTMIIQPQPIQMYHLVNQDEETRRINNLNKYGIEFL